MTILLFIVYIMATHRLALMLAKEDGPGFVFKRLREMTKKKAPRKTALKSGISCIFCVSVWFGILMAVSVFFVGQTLIFQLFILALALSDGAVLLNQAFTKGL